VSQKQVVSSRKPPTIDITDSEEDEQPTRSRKGSTRASSKAPRERGTFEITIVHPINGLQIWKAIVRRRGKAKQFPGHVAAGTPMMRIQPLSDRP
jgi:hypothetical protein